MWTQAIIFVITATVVLGCSGRKSTPRTLKSGKEVRLLFAGVVQDAFSIEYCSELPLSDRRVLASETDEVFDAFRADITESGRPEALVWPTVCSWQVRWSGWIPIVVGEESTSFHYSPAEDGAWARRN
jgi:hypothetical protein